MDPAGSLSPTEVEAGRCQLAPPESSRPIPRPAWAPSTFCGASGPRPAPGDYPARKGPHGLVGLAITEKKAWLLFMSCVEKSL